VTIGPGVDGHDTDQIMQRLDAWIANVARWPRSLREVSWNHRVARR